MFKPFCDVGLAKEWIDACATKYDSWWLNLAYDWQTLITGLAAGVPAAIGAWLLWSQINDQRKASERAKHQQEVAARIKMPHALSQLSDYWRHCFRAIISENFTLKTENLPVDALEIIMTAAPSVSEASFETLRKLVTSSQIFESRFRSAMTGNAGKMIATLLIDVARLDHCTDALYEFARFEVDGIAYKEPTRADLASQIYNNLDLHDRLCAVESKRLRVEASLNSEFANPANVIIS